MILRGCVIVNLQDLVNQRPKMRGKLVGANSADVAATLARTTGTWQCSGRDFWVIREAVCNLRVEPPGELPLRQEFGAKLQTHDPLP
jgi:hypothetical protein